MTDDYFELLEKGLKRLDELEIGSKEYCDLARAICDLERAYAEEKGLDMKLLDRYEDKLNAEKDRKSKLLTTGLDAFVNVLKVVALLIVAGSTLKFEETGAIRSTALKWAPKIF